MDTNIKATHATYGSAEHAKGHKHQYHVNAHVDAAPARVLDVLADPESVKRWFPVPCSFEDGVTRLEAGKTYKAKGKLSGKEVDCTLEVFVSNEAQVIFALNGPVIVELEANLRPAAVGTDTDVHISVHSAGGIKGKLLAAAASALIRAGALDKALSDIRKEAEAS